MMSACGPIRTFAAATSALGRGRSDRAMNADQTTTTGLCEARMRICSNAFVQSTAPAQGSLHRRLFLGGHVHDNRRTTRRKESINFEAMSIRRATAHIQTPVS